MSANDTLKGELEHLGAQSVPDVLETMFFAAAERAESGAPVEPCYHVQVRFRGCPSGIFVLQIGAPTASALAACFLGVEEAEVGPMEAAQVACELANMVCGSILSRAESETGFELDSPLLTDATSSAAPNQEPAYHGIFALDLGAAIDVRFWVQVPGMVGV